MPDALLLPAYQAPGTSFAELLAVLAVTGVANRAGPRVWLNASSRSWVNGVPVNWPYPSADAEWTAYLSTRKNVSFDVAPAGAGLCALLSDTRVAPAIKGLVLYDDSAALDGLQWAAVTAAGLHSGVPVTPALRAARASCLQNLPVVYSVPPAASFADDLSVYAWATEELLPHTSQRLLVGACHARANYSCGWGDPLGTAAVDWAVAQGAMVVNLSPDTSAAPAEAAAFSAIAAHLEEGAVFSGWAEPEADMVALLSTRGAVVLCGAPNLSFLATLPATLASPRLPLHRTLVPAGTAPAALNRSAVYLAFLSNEGDTPKNAYSFRGGNWLLPRPGGHSGDGTGSSHARGGGYAGDARIGSDAAAAATGTSAVVSWGSAPLVGRFFPALWEYYVETAAPRDQFFSACAGAGYAYPWTLPDPDGYFARAAALDAEFMPTEGGAQWVDVWEGGCPAGAGAAAKGDNPCLAMYGRFRNASLAAVPGGAGAVGGFSQQPTLDNETADPHYVYNNWLPDGTPLFLPPKALWYPNDLGFCNETDGGHGVRPSPASLDEEFDCVEVHLRRVAAGNPQRPLFVVAYGVSNYVDVARAMGARLGPPWALVGTQDLAVLGRAAAPAAADTAPRGDGGGGGAAAAAAPVPR